MEKLFNEKVIYVAMILEQVKNRLTNVSENDKQLIDELEEKDFITSLGRAYYTSATGEEALSEYQESSKRTWPSN